MDINRLTIIAEWLENGAPPRDGVSGFDMSSFFQVNECGTVCCIAGAACMFFGAKWCDNACAEAADLLDINIDIDGMENLFYPITDRHLDSITPNHAAQVIRHLIKTGKVDWTVGAS